jgi:hypothetical protein
MKKINNTNFVKDLINSDFLILNKNENFKVLNLMELNKELKQFIRLLQLLIETKAPLYIIVENKHTANFIIKFFETFSTKVEILVQTNIIKKSEKAGLLLILEESAHSKNESFFKKLFRNNFFLVNKINSNIEKEFLGYYKIFNDVSDIKKMIFILTLIRNVLK